MSALIHPPVCGQVRNRKDRRRNPYTHQHIESSEISYISATPWISAPYPHPILNATVSLESLNDHLQAVAAKHPLTEVPTLPSTENKRVFVVYLRDVARFNVFLGWQAKCEIEVPSLMRISVIGLHEDVSLSALHEALMPPYFHTLTEDDP